MIAKLSKNIMVLTIILLLITILFSVHSFFSAGERYTKKAGLIHEARTEAQEQRNEETREILFRTAFLFCLGSDDMNKCFKMLKVTPSDEY